MTDRYCATCLKVLVRKTYPNGRPEDKKLFEGRLTCGSACAAALRQEIARAKTGTQKNSSRIRVELPEDLCERWKAMIRKLQGEGYDITGAWVLRELIRAWVEEHETENEETS